MTDTPMNSTVMPGRRALGARVHSSTLIALGALVVAAAAGFWMAGQPSVPRGGMTPPQVVLILALAVFVVALFCRFWDFMCAAVTCGAGDLIAPVIWGVWLVIRAIFAMIAAVVGAFLGS